MKKLAFLICFILLGINIYSFSVNSLDKLLIKVNTINYLKTNQNLEEIAKMSINEVSKNDLLNIPGIGPELASAIINFRDQRGPITDLSQLKKVSGIGDKKLEILKQYLTVSPVKSSGGGPAVSNKNSVSANINYSNKGGRQTFNYDLQVSTINNEVLKIAGQIAKSGNSQQIDFFIDYAVNNATCQANVTVLLKVVNNIIQQLQANLNYQEDPQKRQEIKQNLGKLENLKEELISKKSKLPPFDREKVDPTSLSSSDSDVNRVEGLQIINANPPVDGTSVDPTSRIEITFSEPVSEVGFISVVPVGLEGKVIPGKLQLVNNHLYYTLSQPMLYNTDYIVKLIDVKGQTETKNFEYKFRTERMLSQDNLNKAIKGASTFAAIFGQIASFISALNGILYGTGGGGN